MTEPSIADKNRFVAECMGWKPNKAGSSPMARWFSPRGSVYPRVPDYFTDAAALMEAEEWLEANHWAAVTSTLYASGWEGHVQFAQLQSSDQPSYILTKGDTRLQARAEAVYQACLALKGEVQ